MDWILLLLILFATGFFILANYLFIINTRPENYDAIGSSISFDQPFAMSNICLFSALTYSGLIQWPIAIIGFFIIEAVSLFYKWKILNSLIKWFRK